MSQNNGNSSDSNSRNGEPIFQATQLNSNSILRLGVLRPSVLGSTLNTVTTTERKDEDVGLNSSPFVKDEAGAAGGATASTTGVISAENTYDEEPDERPDPLKILSRNGLERSNLFTAARNSIPRVAKTGYVFGENVHERVVGENILLESRGIVADKSLDASDMGCFLFSSVIQNAAAAKSNGCEITGGIDPKETEFKSLNEVAREYEESRAQKRKYEEVQTFTGEENEVNIIDVSCKLFAFINSNWEERGRGSLRLNDAKDKAECSRVVFRTSGNLRVLVNTKVWDGMVADRHSAKSLRLTAMDNNGQIKIFLVMARPADIIILHKALTERIHIRKNLHSKDFGSDDFKQEKSGNRSGEVSLEVNEDQSNLS